MTKRITTGLLLILIGWASVATVQAQSLISWTITPTLRLTDTNDQDVMGDIPFHQRSAPLRLHLSLRMERTGPYTGGVGTWDGNSLGVSAFQGGIYFLSTDTSASTTEALAALEGTITSSLMRPGPLAAPSPQAPSAHGVSESGVGYSFNFQKTLGAQPDECSPATGTNTCNIAFGHIEFTPNIPPGVSVTAQVGGYITHLNRPTINPISQVDYGRVNLAITHAEEDTSLILGMRQLLPALALSGADVTLVEGESAEFTVTVAEGASLVGDAVISLNTVASSTGGANAPNTGNADISVNPNIPATMMKDATELVLTITAVVDMVEDSALETIEVGLNVISGAVRAPTSATFTLSILDIIQPPTDDDGNDLPINREIPPGGQQLISVRPEGAVRVHNNSGNIITFMQATTSGALVMMEVTDFPDTSEHQGFVGTFVQMPPSIVSDGDTNSTRGEILVANFNAESDAIDSALAEDLYCKETESPCTVGNIVLRHLPNHFEPLEGGPSAFDLNLHLDGMEGTELSAAVDVCLPRSGVAQPARAAALFRFDETVDVTVGVEGDADGRWVPLGSSEVSRSNAVCGTTAEFSAFAAMFGSSTTFRDIARRDESDDPTTRALQNARVLFEIFFNRGIVGIGR